MNSYLYEGRLRHRRYSPRRHEFGYQVFYAYLDLDELDRVFERRWFWSCHRPAPVRFHRSDHIGESALPLSTVIRNRITETTGRISRGPIRLLTHMRHFGYVFNPVSFYFCFDAHDNDIEYIAAEVTNTPWGERHLYILPRPAEAPPDSRLLRYQLDKEFHISPFMPMDVRYDWRFLTPGKNLSVHMENHRGGNKLFDATLVLKRRPINGLHCARALAGYPLVTLKVISAIYWQALRLYMKRIPVHYHPDNTDKHDNDEKHANRI